MQQAHAPRPIVGHGPHGDEHGHLRDDADRDARAREGHGRDAVELEEDEDDSVRGELEDAVANADLVITGEGHLDTESFNGKVVGSVASIAERHAVPVVAVVGARDSDLRVPSALAVISLVESFGPEMAKQGTLSCLASLGSNILSFASPDE